jgi:hypothetical protein
VTPCASGSSTRARASTPTSTSSARCSTERGNADLTHYQRNIQTALVPAGGGGVFDVKIDQPGLYPFVSHSFASVDLGQVGLLNVGNVAGTMSH